MNKKDKIFLALAITGVGLGIYALVRYEVMLSALNDIAYSYEEFITSMQFAEIVANYDEDGD